MEGCHIDGVEKEMQLFVASTFGKKCNAALDANSRKRPLVWRTDFDHE
jgi:hypothetical protein